MLPLFYAYLMVKKKSILEDNGIPTQQNGWKNLPLSTDIILHGIKEPQENIPVISICEIYSSLMI